MSKVFDNGVLRDMTAKEQEQHDALQKEWADAVDQWGAAVSLRPNSFSLREAHAQALAKDGRCDGPLLAIFAMCDTSTVLLNKGPRCCPLLFNICRMLESREL